MPDRGADFLQLSAAEVPRGRLTDWLTHELRSAVADGRLATGNRLPATRTLAGDLGIARGVVVEAYQRLTDEGLVEPRAGSGTTVLPAALSPRRPPRPHPGADPLRLPRPTSAPLAGEIDLSPGVPDLSAFPRAAWLRAEREVLSNAPAAELGYGDPRGSERLRTHLVGWLARTRGLRVEPQEILVVGGVAQALALLAQTLRRRGTTTIGVEDPGSKGAREEFAHWGLASVGVPVDGEGLDVAALTAAGVEAVMVTPAHQFPTGVVLSPGRRRELLAWAAAGGLVIEDDYDAEHRYDRAPVPALHPSAPEQVAHTGSVSKSLAPGMRLGWLVTPAGMEAELVAAKHASDLGSPVLPQLVLAELLSSGAYERHLRLVRGRQRARRDALVTALQEHAPGARVDGVAAGLHVLVTFPASEVDDVAVAEAVRGTGVIVHPLSWHRLTLGPPGLVLGYAAHAPDRLREAVVRMVSELPGPVRERGRR